MTRTNKPLLLDANVIVWWMHGDRRLGEQARTALASAATPLYVSLFTVFELELKIKAGKLRLPGKTAEFLEKFDVKVHAPTAGEMPDLLAIPTGHGDPFDRALVGLGALKGWEVLTCDERLLGLKSLPVGVIDSRQ